MVVREACPQCASHQCKKNGYMHNGKQNHQGKQCGRQCGLYPEKCGIDEVQRSWVVYFLLEKISLYGVCRAAGVSIRWLMDFMGACLKVTPEDLPVQLPSRPREVIWQCVGPPSCASALPSDLLVLQRDFPTPR
jgi:hypothetical protein